MHRQQLTSFLPICKLRIEYIPAEIIDAANELAQQRIDMAVAAHRINHNAVSATNCIECGEKISDKRRKAVKGCTMCADCQHIAELKRKQRGI